MAVGDGSRLPAANELQGARYQGRKIAETANKAAPLMPFPHHRHNAGWQNGCGRVRWYDEGPGAAARGQDSPGHVIPVAAETASAPRNRSCFPSSPLGPSFDPPFGDIGARAGACDILEGEGGPRAWRQWHRS